MANDPHVEARGELADVTVGDADLREHRVAPRRPRRVQRLLARLLGRIKKNPKMALKISQFSLGRILEEKEWAADFIKAVMMGKRWSINPFVVIVHNFMSTHELETKEGQERLQACAFKVPVNGRMVSMCELNGTDMRKDKNEDDQDRLITIGDPLRRAV